MNLKIRAVVGSYVIVETAQEWVTYNTSNRNKIRISKKETPLYLIASYSKWGYVSLREPLEIASYGSIDIEKVNALRAFEGSVS
ncbi:MAG TPA: hypothetical protein ENI27_05465 [bacterium]|nr:hypothetical protein [bacterium]